MLPNTAGPYIQRAGKSAKLYNGSREPDKTAEIEEIFRKAGKSII